MWLENEVSRNLKCSLYKEVNSFLFHPAVTTPIFNLETGIACLNRWFHDLLILVNVLESPTKKLEEYKLRDAITSSMSPDVI